MDPTRMNAILAQMTPDEIRDALWFVDVFERGGVSSAEEADEWRRRIRSWQHLLELTDDPDLH